MKPEELMIGDWVKFPIGYEKIQEISYQQEIGGYCVWFAASATLFPSKIEDIEPIPLTPEILEKNGFIIKKKWAQIGNFGNSPLIVWHFEDDTILHDFKHELEIHQNDTGKVHVKIPCEYVHQLQHALKLCGIYKEIVL